MEDSLHGCRLRPSSGPSPASSTRRPQKVNALIAKREHLIELLEEKRTALISRAVTKGLDPDVPMKDSAVNGSGRFRHIGRRSR